MAQTILAKIKEEHRDIEALLRKIEHSSPSGLRHSLFQQLKDKLIQHMAGEEETLYHHLAHDSYEDLATDIVKEAMQEHHNLKEFLQRLNLMDPDSVEWMNEFHDLKMQFDNHVQDEETEIFMEAKDDFSKEELIDFGTELEELKHHPLL